MGELLKSDLTVSVTEYLAGEVIGGIQHEYAGGEVYAMAGASNVHNIIALNLAAALHNHLDDSPRVPYVSDMKVKGKRPMRSCLIIPMSWWPAIQPITRNCGAKNRS